MKIVTVVGARPEFIMTAPVSKALRQRHTEILVHTGQHYDDNMSGIFFEELDLPRPEINLEVGSGSHAEQTGQMLIRLEAVLIREKPACVIVYGDTNSTLAGSLAATKLDIPVVHIEAGLRSFDRTMPEEVNRVLTDHMSHLLFAPTQVAVENLAHEGITERVCLVGDIRVDLLKDIQVKATTRQRDVLIAAEISEGVDFALATIHRASNTDEIGRLRTIVETMNSLDLPVVLPIHPRLHKMMNQFGLKFTNNVHTIDPVGFLEMVALLDACRIVITDSGGLQKESYILRRPTVTVRDSTEWVETVQAGWNRLCGPDVAVFKAAVDRALQSPPAEHPEFYGSYGVSQRICQAIEADVTAPIGEVA
ncbi:MAG: non-hydrolyzing UDP-N-acetylglucosamine 2-epimerase [Aggregatilineales bacterium]